MAGLHAGTILLLVLWTGWLLIALPLLRDQDHELLGLGLLAVFVPLAILLALKTNVTWRGYLMAWLPIYAVVAVWRAEEEHRQNRVVLALISLGGLTWLWSDGGWLYVRPIVTGVIIAASVAAFALVCCGAWRLRDKRRPWQTRPEPVPDADPPSPSKCSVDCAAPILPPRALLPEMARETTQTSSPPRPASEPSSAVYMLFTVTSAMSSGIAVPVWMTRVDPGSARDGGTRAPDAERPQPGYARPGYARHVTRDVFQLVEQKRGDGSSLGSSFVKAGIGMFSAEIGNGVSGQRYPTPAVAQETGMTSDRTGLGRMAQGVTDVDRWLHSCVGLPIGAVAGSLGADPVLRRMAEGIGSNMILAPVDQVVNGAARKIELIGIAVSVVIGAHPLGLLCTKLFLHSQLNREIGKALTSALSVKERDVTYAEIRTAGEVRAAERPRLAESVREPELGSAEHGTRAQGPTRPSANTRELIQGANRLTSGLAQPRVQQEELEPSRARPAVSQPGTTGGPVIDRSFGIGPAS